MFFRISTTVFRLDPLIMSDTWCNFAAYCAGRRFALDRDPFSFQRSRSVGFCEFLTPVPSEKQLFLFSSVPSTNFSEGTGARPQEAKETPVNSPYTVTCHAFGLSTLDLHRVLHKGKLRLLVV